MPARNEIELVYDGQCPVCNYYSRKVELSAGDLVRVDARQDSEILREITASGLDIDEGMALKVGDTLYFGSDAVHELALLSSRKGFFNKVCSWMFRSARVTKTLYPTLVIGRNLLLRVLGRSRINNLGKTSDQRF